MNTALSLVEAGLVPDTLTRRGIRRLLRQRLQEITAGDCEAQGLRHQALVAELRGSPIAIHTDDANAQHYEVPAAFFDLVLGARRKYSSCYYPDGVQDLDSAEEAMLRLTGERAQLEDGQSVLELGCGWGAISLWMAQRYPRSRIVAVSNSHSQRDFIMRQAGSQGLDNLEVRTADMNEFDIGERFDRIVSVEMFEHMRNYQALMGRVARWLAPDGRLFLHVFCHREHPYKFEARDDTDWMSRYFFTGGLMPSHDLLLHFQDDLVIDQHWKVSGTHYQRTSEDWLKNLDARRDDVLSVLRETYGAGQEKLWLSRWRVFFLAVAELFGFRGGEEWWVGHYRFQHRRAGGRS